LTDIKEKEGRTLYEQGIIAILGCEMLWGVLPIYWKTLEPISSFMIILYRVVLIALLCYIVTAVRLGVKNVFQPMFANRRAFIAFVFAGMIITFNWSLYIWAVNANYVIQTAMGYYLEPLVICIFGILIFKEKANVWKKIALGFAMAGIIIMIIGYKEFPSIAVGLAFSFAIYAAIKKTVLIHPLQSMLYEVILIAPFFLAAVLYYEIHGMGALSQATTLKYVLLMFAGVCTCAPLGLFSFAANKVPLFTVGMLSYISPTISLILGVYMFNEPFNAIKLAAFAIIWVGLAFFTHGEILDNRRDKRLDRESD